MKQRHDKLTKCLTVIQNRGPFCKLVIVMLTKLVKLLRLLGHRLKLLLKLAM